MLKLAGYETKYLLKQAVKDLAPQEILNRPKQGFGVPVQEWINKQLRGRIRDTLTSAQARQRGYVQPSYLNILLDEHETGRRDHSMAVWALFMFELWHREFMDPAKPLANEPLYKTEMADTARRYTNEAFNGFC